MGEATDQLIPYSSALSCRLHRLPTVHEICSLHLSLFLSADLRYQASIISARCVHRTSRHAIAMMFLRLSVGPSVCLSVCLGRRACIVIIRCTLARIHVYCLIVQCSGHHDTKACPPILPAVFFSVPPGRQVGYRCAN